MSNFNHFNVLFSSKVDRKKESCFSHFLFFFFMCAAERLILKEEVGSEENSHCAHADHTATQNSKVNKNRLYVPQKVCFWGLAEKIFWTVCSSNTDPFFFLPIKGPESVVPHAPPPRAVVYLPGDER